MNSEALVVDTSLFHNEAYLLDRFNTTSCLQKTKGRTCAWQMCVRWPSPSSECCGRNVGGIVFLEQKDLYCKVDLITSTGVLFFTVVSYVKGCSVFLAVGMCACLNWLDKTNGARYWYYPKSLDWLVVQGFWIQI